MSCSPSMAGIRSMFFMDERTRPLAGRALTTTSFKVVVFVPQRDDEGSVAFCQLVSFTFVVDV